MNKWLIGALVFFGLLAVGLWGFYFYQANKLNLPAGTNVTGQNSPDIVTPSPTPTPDPQFVWTNVRPGVLASCNTTKILLVKNDKDGAYHNVLYDAFSELTFNTKSATYTSPIGLSLSLSYSDISGDYSSESKGCAIARLTDTYGNGNIAYLDSTGKVVKAKVLNFTPTGSPPPQPSVSPTP